MNLIGQHLDSYGIKHQWYGDADGNVTVRRSQDAQQAVDTVAAVNANGGARTVDGLGRPIAEVPVVAAMEWAEKRGIPWEKLLYSNEYDAEFKRFAQEHSRLQYEVARNAKALT